VPGQLRPISAFKRRCDEDWIVPQVGQDDPFVDEEGLYPSVVVPKYTLGENLVIIYKAEIISAEQPGNDDFKPEYMGFNQEVRNRFVVIRKSKSYYNESSLVTDNSPDGFYPTLILPKSLIGKEVILIR